MSLYDPVGMPRTLRGTPSHIELATVSIVNSDGTIDAQMVGRTAIKSQLEVPRWYKPMKGDRILTTDIAGDQNRPIVIAFVSDEKGSSKQPQGGFTNPSEPKTELVSVLPGSPVDGQQVYFQNTTMATAGVVWHLRYRSASSSAHKWEFVGGSSLQTFNESTSHAFTANTWEAMSATLELMAPLPGDYEVRYTGALNTAATSNPVVWVGVSVAGAEPAGLTQTFTNLSATSEIRVVYAADCVIANVTEGQVLSQRYKSNVTLTVNSYFRHLLLAPVRVG
jgi:hypothetical protein